MQTMTRLRRSGIGVPVDRTIGEVAKVMNSSGIGVVAVLDGDDLVGMVTDRDLVRRGLAKGLPTDARIDAVMSSPVVSIDADAELHDAVAIFQRHAIRRVAVVDHGQFVGVISLDDLLLDLARDLSSLTAPLASQVDAPHRDSSVPASV